jgi:hypothetical protein
VPTNLSAFSHVNQFVSPLRVLSTLMRDDGPAPDWGFDLDLRFEQLSLFVRHLDTASAVVRCPVFGLARFAITRESRAGLTGADAEATPRFPSFPLGVIGTDHTGYGSFDLWPLRHVQVVSALREALDEVKLIGPGKRVTVELSQLLLLPFKDPTIAFDALSEGDLGPNFICVRMDLDATMLEDRGEWPPMPAIQTPGILDWRLSPGSFSTLGALLIGENGCETLLPSNLATRLIRFSQVIRSPVKAEARANPDHAPAPGFSGEVRLGYLLEYHSEWFSLGHSLGQIAYTMPLAPGEKVNVAIIDWSRRDAAKRIEQTTEKEDLNHAAVRDRSLTEAVQMVVRESQSGSSFMAGNAGSMGVGIPIGAVSLGAGAAHSFGGATASSEGVRSIVGSTTQQITDAFHQASTALRELNSTVVVQGEQAESAQARTRVVANYNHSHALTLLYYEVLQHHRVLTRPVSIRPALLLKHDVPRFVTMTKDGQEENDYSLIMRHIKTIGASLLDASLRACLDAVQKMFCHRINFKDKDPGPVASDDFQLGEMMFWVKTGATQPTRYVQAHLVLKDGPPVRCLVANMWPPAIPNPEHYYFDYINEPGSDRIHPNTLVLLRLRPERHVRWGNVAHIELKHFVPAGTTVTGTPANDWAIESLHISTTDHTHYWVMFDGSPPDSLFKLHTTMVLPVKRYVPPPGSPWDMLSDEERCCIKRLVEHLDAHQAHYWRAIRLAETAPDRALRLSGWQVGDVALLDFVENTVVDFVDDYAVMPAVAGAENALAQLFATRELGRAQLPYNHYVEQILTLPTRGVFAEAKLGHCNASEIIDPTRFWDWQASPIPDQPPPIAAVSTESRHQDQTEGLKATPFPTSLVNIVNPQALPDPTGLSTVTGVLSALGPFRDMSGIKELGSLLQTLSNNATQLASQGLKNAQTGSLLNMIRGSGELSKEQKADLVGQLLTGQAKPAPQVSSPSTVGGAGATGATSSGEGGGGTTESAPQTEAPTQAPAQEKPPAPVKPTTKRPTPVLSPKTRKLTFVFQYDTNEIMKGRWKVTLMGGGEVPVSESRLIDTEVEVSGVAIGNRIEMIVPATFAATDDVTIEITGSIVQRPKTFSSSTRIYRVDGWTLEKRATKVIGRAAYDKAQTYNVTQPTSEVEFTVTTSASDTKSTVKVTGQTAGVEVGVESSAEAGGPGLKGTVKVAAKGTYSVTSQEQEGDQATTGTSEQVRFNARRVSDASPDIAPI